jgi:hypothetical protein
MQPWADAFGQADLPPSMFSARDRSRRRSIFCWMRRPSFDNEPHGSRWSGRIALRGILAETLQSRSEANWRRDPDDD